MGPAQRGEDCAGPTRNQASAGVRSGVLFSLVEPIAGSPLSVLRRVEVVVPSDLVRPAAHRTFNRGIASAGARQNALHQALQRGRTVRRRPAATAIVEQKVPDDESDDDDRQRPTRTDVAPPS